MTTFFSKANGAKSTITDNPLGASTLVINVASGTGGRFPASNFIITLYNATTYPDPNDDPQLEHVLVSTRAGDVLTIGASGRGKYGTTGVSHVSGTNIRVLIMKEHMDEYETAIHTAETNITSLQTLAYPAATFATNDLLYATSATQLSRLVATSTANQVLGHSSGVPTWVNPLGVTAPYVAGDILYAGSTTAFSKLAIGLAGEVLTVDSSGVPNYLPLGFSGMLNGQIITSVSSNNLTVAIKGLDGNDPSTTNPVYVRIGNTIRAITAALSVTKNAGTNYFTSGSTGTATNEIDYFVYLVWNTTPATDIVDLGFSRLPAETLYSDFSGTSTSEKYLATANASAPTATDECQNIGRFNATLSATASFNWSLPATSVIIQHPIFQTRVLATGLAPTGFSGSPFASGHYMVAYRTLHMLDVQISGTSNAVGFGFTIPLAALYQFDGVLRIGDNGAFLDKPGLIEVLAASATVGVYKDGAANTFTGSGTKTIQGAFSLFIS